MQLVTDVLMMLMLLPLQCIGYAAAIGASAGRHVSALSMKYLVMIDGSCAAAKQ